MRFETNPDELITAFSESVSNLTDQIVDMCEETDKNDPDPERTKCSRMDRMIRAWFNNGGGMGY